MAEKPILGYWHIRGLAESIRYLLDYLGVDFEDRTYTQGPAPDFDRSAWTNAVDSLQMDFPNLPYFIDGDMKISESAAIFDYIVNQYGPALSGDSNKEKAVVKQLGGVIHDIKGWLTGTCYSPEFHQHKDGLLADVRPELAKLARFLGDKQYLIGDKITWPDFYFFETLEMLNALHPGYVAESDQRLEAYRARIAALPQLQKRLSGERLAWNNTQAAWR